MKITTKKILIKFEQTIVILFLISIPFLIYFLIQTKSVHTYNGTIIDFGATSDDTKIYSFFIVKLDNNRTIKVDYQLASGLYIGKKVIVKERTTKLFNIKSYEIIRWLKHNKTLEDE